MLLTGIPHILIKEDNNEKSLFSLISKRFFNEFEHERQIAELDVY